MSLFALLLAEHGSCGAQEEGFGIWALVPRGIKQHSVHGAYRRIHEVYTSEAFSSSIIMFLESDFSIRI